MKKSELKQIIKEEIQRSLNESFYDNFEVYEDEFKKRGFKWMEEDYQDGGISDTFYKKFPLGVFSIHIESDNANKWYVNEKPRHEQYHYDFTFDPYPKYKKYLFGLIKSKHPQVGKSIDLGKGNIDFGEGLFLVDDNTFKTEFFSKIDKALDEVSKITDVKYMSQEDSKSYSTYFLDQMKESRLKQIIKEEILKVLKESHKPGDKVIVGGLGTVTIDKEENGLIYFTDRKGNKYKRNYAQFKKETQGWNKLNESPYPLVPRKNLILKLITDNGLENEYKVDFIKNGRPSEYHLENVVQDLKSKGIDVSSIYKPISPKPIDLNIKPSSTDPYKMYSPTKTQFGDYTGD